MDYAFNQLCKSIAKLETLYNERHDGKSATASARNLWKEGQKLNTLLREQKRDYEDQYRTAAARFESGYKLQQRNEYEHLVNDAFQTVIAGFKADIDTYVNGKTEKIDLMLTTPPSPNQRDLLESLKLRGSMLSHNEAMRILPVFYTNYVALEAFRGICKAAGYNLYVPMESGMDLYSIVEEFQKYMYHIADQLGANKPDLIAGSFFFMDSNPDYVEPTVEKFSWALDSVPQLRNDSSDALSAGEQARIRILFRGIEELNPDNTADMIKIVTKTEKIVKDHPDDLQTILKSPYGKYVDLCFNLKKAKMDAIAVKTLAGKEDGKSEGET